MSAPVRVVLTSEEDRTLQELRVTTTVPQRTRDRAHVVRLNAQGLNAPALAKIFGCCEPTIATSRRWREQATLKRWQTLGLAGLWDAPGRGDKPKWQEADRQYLEQCLKQDPRTYTSQQLAQTLKEQRHVELSAERIRRLLKKRAGDGNGRATATNRTKTRRPDTLSRLT